MVEGALSRLADPKAIDELIQRIRNTPSQSFAITQALVAIGGSAIDAQLELLRANPPRMANAVAVGVARGGSEKHLKTLFEVVGPEVACGALSQAAGYGKIPGAKGVSLEMLKPALSCSKSLHRSNAYVALGALKLKGARRLLEKGLEDSDSVVRQSACAGLQYLGDPKAAPAIIKAYDKLAGRGRMALLAMAEPVMDAVEAGLAELAPATRSDLLRLLAEVRGPSAAPVFRRSLDDNDDGVRRTSLALLAPMCTDKDVPRLAELLLDTDLWRAAAKALGNLGTNKALNVLEAAAAAIASKNRRTKEEKIRQEFFELLV